MKSTEDRISTVTIGAIKVSNVNYDIILHHIKRTIKTNGKLSIVYANANTVNRASSDAAFCEAINSADIVHPDGIGVFSASKMLNKRPLMERFNWTDYGYPFIEECISHNWRIFMLGSTSECLEKAIRELKKHYPLLKIVGSKDGYGDLKEPGLIGAINSSEADILWVGMGSPKQELWIHENINKIDCKIIQAVGDLYALFAGDKPRGSKLVQQLGLEWLVRLVHNPARYWRRTLIGIPVFVKKIILLKIKGASKE